MSKAYVFTWNNYTDESIKLLNELDCSYLVYGKEVGESGTPHLQGYVEFEKQKKFQTVCNILKGAHIELRRGTGEQASAYCKKDNDFTERGEMKVCKPGKRTDIDHARKMVRAGGMRLLTKKVQSQQALNIAIKYLEYNEEPRDWLPNVTWIWGESGTGKSTMARSMFTQDIYIKNTSTKWWLRYDGHENVIIDDFRDSWWSITDMLSLLDSTERHVETKGGIRQFKGRNIVITSINHPETCYESCKGEPKEQLLRRITKIIHLERAKTEHVETTPNVIYESETITIIEHPDCTQKAHNSRTNFAQSAHESHPIFDNIDDLDIIDQPCTERALPVTVEQVAVEEVEGNNKLRP